MNYEMKFFDIYDSNYDNRDKIEELMQEFNIDWKVYPDGPSYLEDDEYKILVKEFEANYGETYTDETFIETVIEALREEFDDVHSFDDVGMMTNNMGVVVNVNGKQFQLALLGSWK